MGELTPLIAELRTLEDIGHVREGSTGCTIAFTVPDGHYSPLTSEMLSILGRYDANVYPESEGAFDYRAVVPERDRHRGE